MCVLMRMQVMQIDELDRDSDDGRPREERPSAREKSALPAAMSAWRNGVCPGCAASASTGLPRIVWQTTRSPHALPAEAVHNRLRMQRDNPGWSFRLVGDDEMASFMLHDRWAAPVRDAWSTIGPGAARADLWRYCILFAFGGVYLDVDAALNGSLDSWLRPSDGAVLALEGREASVRYNDWPFFGNEFIAKRVFSVKNIHHLPGQLPEEKRRRWSAHRIPDVMLMQWLLVFEPRHALLAELIREVATHVCRWRDDERTAKLEMGVKVLWLTGPAILTAVVHRMVSAGDMRRCDVPDANASHAPSPCFRLMGTDYDGHGVFRYQKKLTHDRMGGGTRYADEPRHAPFLRHSSRNERAAGGCQAVSATVDHVRSRRLSSDV